MSGPDALLRHLFSEHARYVHASLRRLGVHPSDLQDLTQDVFMAVHGALEGFDPRRPVRPWLFAFCYRIAANHRRLARHRYERVESPTMVIPDHADPRDTPDETLRDHQERALLARALEALSDEQRAVFIMHDIDGTEGRDIAAALGVPRNTVYSRLRLARARVEALLREQAQRELHHG